MTVIGFQKLSEHRTDKHIKILNCGNKTELCNGKSPLSNLSACLESIGTISNV